MRRLNKEVNLNFKMESLRKIVNRARAAINFEDENAVLSNFGCAYDFHERELLRNLRISL